MIFILAKLNEQFNLQAKAVRKKTQFSIQIVWSKSSFNILAVDPLSQNLEYHKISLSLDYKKFKSQFKGSSW